MIDLLLEKFLTGYKSPQRIGEGVEVFENPTPSELREVLRATDFDAARFIVDSKKKKVYVWNAALMLHLQMWNNLSKELSDSRRLYNNGTLLSGEYTKKGIYDWYSMSLNDQKDLMYFWIEDWKWVDKYLPNFDKDVRLELPLHIWNENKDKLNKQGYKI